MFARMVIFPTPNPLPPLSPSPSSSSLPPPLPTIPHIPSFSSSSIPSPPIHLSSASSFTLSTPSSPLLTTESETGPAPGTTRVPATATDTNLGSISSSYPSFSLTKTISVAQIQGLQHRNEQPLQSPYSKLHLYSHINSHSGSRTQRQVRRSLQELAQEQYRQNHQRSRYACQQQVTHRPFKTRPQCSSTFDQRPHPPRHYPPLPLPQPQRNNTYIHPVYSHVQTSEVLPPPPQTRSYRPRNYFSRVLKRLYRLNCVRGSGLYSSKQNSSSFSSIYLPRVAECALTGHSTGITFTSSSSVYQQYPGSKRRRISTTRRGASTSIEVDSNILRVWRRNSRGDKGKQRASSRFRTRSGSSSSSSVLGFKGVQRHHLHVRRRRRRSSLPFSTIHSWCPYYLKTIPTHVSSERHDYYHYHHHHCNHPFCLIPPTPTPQETHSRSSSISQSHSVEVQLSVVSIGTALQSDSIEPCSSSLDQDIENKGIVPDTLFTFVHPLPHVVATSKRQLAVTGYDSHQRVDTTASTPTVSPASSTHSTPSPHPCPKDIGTAQSHQHVSRPKESKLEAVVNRLFFTGLPSSLNSSNVAVASSASTSSTRLKTTWRNSGIRYIGTGIEEEGEQENLTRLKLPASTPLYTTFLKRLESQPWFSNLPSNAEEDFNIRNPTSFNAGNTALRGKSAVVDSNSNNNSGDTKSKRRSWSTLFTFKNRRSSLPAQSVSSENHHDHFLTVVEKNQTFSVFSGQSPQETDEAPAPHDSRQKDQYSHQYRRLNPIRSKRISAPAPAPTSERKTMMLATQEQSLPPTIASSPIHGRNFSTASIQGENRNRHSLVYDQNKPLPMVMSEQRSSAPMSYPQSHSQSKSTLLMSQEPQPQQTAGQPPKQQKKQRRMSFLPSALKTSNLAKFVSGNNNSNNNSPTPRSDPTISPRSTRSPIVSSPRPIDQREEEQQPPKESELLTIDQFKWAAISCCNEIKSRVAKQRSALNMASNPDLAAKAYTQQQQRQTVPASVPQRKVEKNKSGRFNSNTASMDTIESTIKDPRSIVQALLQVMMSSSSAGESTSTLGGVNGASDGSSTNISDSAPSSHQSPSVQSQNKSLLSLMGISNLRGNSTGGGTTTPKRTRSITQLSLAPAPSSSPSVNPSPSSYSRHQHPQHHNSQHLYSHPSQSRTTSQQYQPAHSHSQQQQHQHQPHAQYQHPRMLRSKKSQTKLAIVQATDAILNPLLLQDLVNLLAFTLSLAPDQWIPWHLYDFFVRPQGMKFKDLIELLPTQSQRILRAILETVDALVDYSVMVVVQHHNMQQQQRQSFFTSPPTTSASIIGNGASGDAMTGISPFIRGPLRQQLSQVHLRGKNEAYTSANNGPGPRSNNGSQYRTEGIAMALAVLDPPLSESFNNTLSSSGLPGNGDDTILHEVTLRARRRQAILDGLSGLVFRPRQDQDTMGSNLYASDQQSGMTMGTDERIKGKRRGSIVIGSIGSKQQQYSSATPTSSAMTAAMMTNSSMRLQQSEREREAGFKAFENLVFAFEEEYHPRKPTTMISAVHTAGVSVHPLEMVGPLDDVPINLSASNTTILAHGHSNPATALTLPRDNTLPAMRNKVPPRQSRSLPLNILPYVTSMSNPNTDDSAIRSLSLPPWRKNSSSSTVNLVHSSSLSLRPDLQSRRSHHSITESHLERPLNRRSTTAAAILSRKRASYSGPTTAISTFLTTAVTTDKKEITGTNLFTPGTTITIPRSVEVSSNTTTKNQTRSEPSASASVPSLPLQISTAPSSAFVRGRSCTIGVVDRGNSDNDKKSARLSARLSATWTSWKDHLLVLEEEEYVIVDTSDSEEEKDKGKNKKEEEQHHETEGANGHSSAANDTTSESDPIVATKEPDGGNIMARKKSGTFGNLEMFAMVVETNAKRLEREKQERWRRQKQRKQQKQLEQQRIEDEEKDDEEKVSA